LFTKKTSPESILETSDLLDSTDMDFNLALHDEPESYPYKMIMLGMGLIVLFYSFLIHPNMFESVAVQTQEKHTMRRK
jgi:hypothetical protein